MEKIASFTIDHLSLLPGLYLSRRDEKDGVTVTTFDLRFTAPNREPAMDIAALHTVEHLFATFMRNSSAADDVVYFGPMGCRTGCYLILFGENSNTTSPSPNTTPPAISRSSSPTAASPTRKSRGGKLSFQSFKRRGLKPSF